MTRFLSESLGAEEPFFRLGLTRLEAANGNPSIDISLSTAVSRETKAKLLELGLDPHDTTAEELYHVLGERVKADDKKLTRTLQTMAATHVSAEADVVAGMVHALKQTPGSWESFSLKATSLRAIMKKVPPKKAMKQLGYRSLDSFLKHESPALILAAAWLSETKLWRQQVLEQYKCLKPSDFEMRRISIQHPNSKQWQVLGKSVVAEKRHNLLSFREMGAIVLLPLPKELPAGGVTVSLGLALHELNEIRAASTFLKLSQVQPDFGQSVERIAQEEPSLNTTLLDRAVPWHLIQRYYARFRDHFHEALFEPHIRREDMSWQSVEHALSQIEPSLAFWHGSAHLGLLHKSQPVSLNIMDAALNTCNSVSFEARATEAFRRSLWHELLLQYLNHDTVEQTVLAQLQPQLVAETVAG